MFPIVSRLRRECRRVSDTKVAVLCLILVFACASVRADVKMNEKSQVKFGGVLGKMMSLFGGKQAKEGLTSSVAIKGDRKLVLTDNNGEIIDLNEEKKYEFDLKKKTYRVVTFEEMRREFEEARRKAEKEAAKSKDSKGQAPELEIDFDIKDTGQTKVVGNHNCRQVIMTITTRQKGKTIDEAGGLVMTVDMWIAPDVTAGKEVADFDRRYFEKVQGSVDTQMIQAMAMYPGLDQAFARMKEKSVDLDGTAMATVTTVEAIPSKEQRAAQQKEEREQGGGGGLLGGFAKRLARKDSDDQSGEASKPNVVMTMNHEILQLSPTVTDEDVALPAGLKLKK
ncbi:MAG TPA: hypothetical protein PLP42_12395 [Acidobacteriota bacterium]|nr:hypothetical protein [Acidobacteriota bacterium]